MGYDLNARRSGEHYYMGAFSFAWMLDAGVGLVINCGPAVKPAQFTFVPDKRGRCPYYNDGFQVDAKQAKAMALSARGLVAVMSHRNQQWADASPEERIWWEKDLDTYKGGVREDFLEKIRGFADFAENSGGFRIS